MRKVLVHRLFWTIFPAFWPGIPFIVVLYYPLALAPMFSGLPYSHPALLEARVLVECATLPISTSV